VLAVNSKMVIDGDPVTVDFRGGLKQRVYANQVGPDNSRTITIKQRDVDMPSTLTLTRRFPRQFKEHDVFSVEAVIQNHRGRDRVVLEDKKPMLLDQPALTQYPAEGDPYKLERPTEFVDPVPGPGRRGTEDAPWQARRPVAANRPRAAATPSALSGA